MTIAIVNQPHLSRPTHTPSSSKTTSSRIKMPSSDPPRHKTKKNTSSSSHDSGKKEPRLRTSCNECADAKVGCTKEHPRCDRCVHKKLDCVYGISQKHGKSQRRKIESTSTSTATKSLLQNASHFGSPVPLHASTFPGIGGGDPNSPLPGGQFRDIRPSYDSLGGSPAYRQALAENSPAWSTTSSEQNTSTNNAMSIDFSYLDTALYSSIDTPQQLSSAPLFSGLATPSEASFFSTTPTLSDPYLIPAPPHSFAAPTSPAPVWGENPYSTSALSASLTEATTRGLSASPFAAHSPSPSSVVCPRFLAGGGECNTEASNLLTLLQSHPSLPPYFTSTTANGSRHQSPNPTSDPAGAPSYDTILHLIHHTYSTLELLQSCPVCARERHILMLQHSIILKTLDWHRSANTYAGSPSPRSSPQQTSISIGSFTPHADDAASIQRLLLMRSLRRLARLIRVVEEQTVGGETEGMLEGAKRELGSVVKGVEKGGGMC